MSRWTHSVCDDCYGVLEPGRQPTRLIEAVLEFCCRCGDLTASGIYYRADPLEMHHCAHRPEE